MLAHLGFCDLLCIGVGSSVGLGIRLWPAKFALRSWHTNTTQVLQAISCRTQPSERSRRRTRAGRGFESRFGLFPIAYAHCPLLTAHFSLLTCRPLIAQESSGPSSCRAVNLRVLQSCFVLESISFFVTTKASLSWNMTRIEKLLHKSFYIMSFSDTCFRQFHFLCLNLV